MEPCTASRKRQRAAAWGIRVAYAVVFAVNVQCALSFALFSDGFTAAWELEGVPGRVAVQGLGVSFLMWNATYPAVIANPRRFRALAAVVLAQQVIGLVGETGILLSLPEGHALIAASIQRFITFDAADLAIMLSATLAHERALREQ